MTINGAREEFLCSKVKEAAAAIGGGDVFGTGSQSVSVSFEFGRLHSLEDVSHTALSARAFEGGRAGTAFVNDPSLWQEALANARQSAPFGEDIPFKLPGPSPIGPLGWKHSPKNCARSKEELRDLGAALVNIIKKAAPKAKAAAEVSLDYSYTVLANGEGFFGEERSSSLGVWGGLFQLDEAGSFIEFYEGHRFYGEEPSLDIIAQPLVERLGWSLREARLDSPDVPVIFAPSALGILLDPILGAANGRVLNKGLSVLKGREGDSIMSSLISIYDDPLLRHGESYAFDDEGTAAKALPLVSGGVFQNFIFDCAQAAKAGKASTGHSARSAGSLPSPSFSNVCIQPGGFSWEALLGEAGTAVLLCEGLGEGQSNVLAGDFSVLGSGAFLVKNGEVVGRLKDLMFSGNAYEVLLKVRALGSQCRRDGRFFCPPLLAEGIKISASGEV